MTFPEQQCQFLCSFLKVENTCSVISPAAHRMDEAKENYNTEHLANNVLGNSFLCCCCRFFHEIYGRVWHAKTGYSVLHARRWPPPPPQKSHLQSLPSATSFSFGPCPTCNTVIPPSPLLLWGVLPSREGIESTLLTSRQIQLNHKITAKNKL